MNLRAFTFIELLVGLTIILTVGTMVFAIFVATLRGTNKSVSTEAVRQNGSYAMTQISRAVRNAKTFDGVSLTGATPFTTSCVMPQGPTPPFTKYQGLKITTFDNTTEIYRCPVSSEDGMYLNGQSLINTNTVVVSDDSCSFTCIQQSASSIPTIGISFTLETKNKTGATDVDSSSPFQTTVSPRNFAR